MPRTTVRPDFTAEQLLLPIASTCPACSEPLHNCYFNSRTITSLDAVTRYHLQISRCHNIDCDRFRLPFRPESEGRFALPHHEFGLDVLALVGNLRYLEHRSSTEIYAELSSRGVQLAPRTVTNLLDRFDQLRTLNATNPQRLAPILAPQKRVLVAIDGLQPQVGHEVLWVVRDCLSGRILLARSLLSSCQNDLADLLTEATTGLGVPVVGVVSDGQQSIRRAVEQAYPGLPHQLCHFHYLREAAQPVYEADRHAKKELKKRVRGIRVIEREAEKQTGPEAEAVLGYCGAVRGALTDSSSPPLDAGGLDLKLRLECVTASLNEAEAEKGGYRKD
jgi:hypothetical protein